MGAMPVEYAQVRRMTTGANSGPGTAEDAGLVARAVACDDTAFDSLFRKYVDYVYNVVHGILVDEDDARDVTQDVFLRAHKSLPQFRHGSRFHTWLYRIAVNRAVDRSRRKSGRLWLPLSFVVGRRADPRPGPAEELDRSEDERAVHRALRELPVRHRQALVLRYFQNLSVEEIAEVLGCSVSAAKVRVHRARAAFKEKYVAANPEESGCD
jgi:RNA polymerase sigma-70 factor, ECF subfamily